MKKRELGIDSNPGSFLTAAHVGVVVFFSMTSWSSPDFKLTQCRPYLSADCLTNFSLVFDRQRSLLSAGCEVTFFSHIPSWWNCCPATAWCVNKQLFDLRVHHNLTNMKISAEMRGPIKHPHSRSEKGGSLPVQIAKKIPYKVNCASRS